MITAVIHQLWAFEGLGKIVFSNECEIGELGFEGAKGEV